MSPSELVDNKRVRSVHLAAGKLPLITLSTTAGTGAEATHFAALYRGQTKYSIAHPAMTPEVAIVDPELTHSMPPSLTATTGLDALCHAMESMWAVGSSLESRQYARQALVLALNHLEEAVARPSPSARRGMCLAAHLAGKAIDISKTTACHALSYRLT